ncbi:hypothetical protein ABPG77_005891 [Micractinium sp. CCAP 211/92]
MSGRLSADTSVCSAARTPHALQRAVQSSRCNFSTAAWPPSRELTRLRSSSSRPAPVVAASGDPAGSQQEDNEGEPSRLVSFARVLIQPLPRSLISSLGTFLCCWQLARLSATATATLAGLMLVGAHQLPALIQDMAARSTEVELLERHRKQSWKRIMAEERPKAKTRGHMNFEQASYVAIAGVIWAVVYWALFAASGPSAGRFAQPQWYSALLDRLSDILLSISFFPAWRSYRLFCGAAEQRRREFAALLAAKRSCSQQP